jgi:NAD(P)-dependent dehydrogenase (short-subunit alcohol dehydrogenase family)
MTISVVTGTNSGIGRATAIHLTQQGHVVYGTVRSVIAGRRAMSDEAWVELGTSADDDDYFSAFESAFGLDIANV